MIQFNHVHAPNKFIIRINMIHGLQKTKSGFRKRKRKRKQKLFSKKKKKTAKIQKRQNWRIKAATTEPGTTYSIFLLLTLHCTQYYWVLTILHLLITTQLPATHLSNHISHLVIYVYSLKEREKESHIQSSLFRHNNSMKEKKRANIQKRDSRRLKVRAHCWWKTSWDGLGWLVGRRSGARSAALSRLRLES